MKSSQDKNSFIFRSYKRPLKYSRFIFRIIILSAFLSILVSQIFYIGGDSQQIVTTDLPCNVSVTALQSQSFSKLMKSFPWKPFRIAIDSIDIPVIQNYSEQLLNDILTPFTIKESPVPINASCQPPQIWEPEKIGPCFHLDFPRKIGVILNFGFDVDALELHLHELDSIVDIFFLVEGTKIHNRYLNTKPSIWDMIKFTPRFSQFRDKIVHFIVDDADYVNMGNSRTSRTLLPDMWDRETLQKNIRLEKFMKWNSATEYFGPQDLIGIGDTDQIPNRNVINFLKYCDLKSENIHIGIWFPFPYIDTIFASDFPVSGHRFTLRNPVYRTVNAINNLLIGNDKDVDKVEDVSFLGGIHFSAYLYLPFQLIKILTGTEYELGGVSSIVDVGIMGSSISIDDNDESFETSFLKLCKDNWRVLENRIKSVDWFRKTYGDHEADTIIKLPWFYECNPERFSSFHRKRDQRLT